MDVETRSSDVLDPIIKSAALALACQFQEAKTQEDFGDSFMHGAWSLVHGELSKILLKTTTG